MQERDAPQDIRKQWWRTEWTIVGWTGVTTLQRKRRCHLQESKSGLYYIIDTLMESGGWMLKDHPTDTFRPMMTKKTPE